MDTLNIIWIDLSMNVIRTVHSDNEAAESEIRKRMKRFEHDCGEDASRL